MTVKYIRTFDSLSSSVGNSHLMLVCCLQMLSIETSPTEHARLAPCLASVSRKYYLRRRRNPC
jgi:hypothetical protein